MAIPKKAVRKTLESWVEVALCVLGFLLIGPLGLILVSLGVSLKAALLLVRFRRTSRRADAALAVARLVDPAAEPLNPLVIQAIADLGLTGRFEPVVPYGWTSGSFGTRQGRPPRLRVGSTTSLKDLTEQATQQNVKVVVAHEWGHVILNHDRASMIFMILDWGLERALAATLVLLVLPLGPVPAIITLLVAPIVLGPPASLVWSWPLRRLELAADRVAVTFCGIEAVRQCLLQQIRYFAEEERVELVLSAIWDQVSEEERNQFIGNVMSRRRPWHEREPELVAIETRLDRDDPTWRQSEQNPWWDRLKTAYQAKIATHPTLEQRLRTLNG